MTSVESMLTTTSNEGSSQITIGPLTDPAASISQLEVVSTISQHFWIYFSPHLVRSLHLFFGLGLTAILTLYPSCPSFWAQR